MTFVPDRLPHTTVQGFDRVRRVDNVANRCREGEERNDVLPVSPPAMGDGRESLTPLALLEVAKRLLGLAAQMHVHLCIEHPIGQGLLQLAW